MTIRELAKKAGVSPATISKAFNNAPDISQEMRRRVLSIAEQEGYRPIRRTSGTTKPRTGLVGPRVGLVYSDIKSHYYSRLVEGYTRRVRELGGILLACDAEFSSERAALFCEYLDKTCRVDAIIILSFSSCDLTAMPKTHAIMIANGRTREAEPPVDGHMDYNFFGVNVRTGILEALRALRDNGHKNIAFLGEERGQSTREIFEESMKSLGLTVDARMIRMSAYRFEEAGRDAMKALLDDNLCPTAILCGYDDIALGASRVLLERGFRIPEDVSLVGVDHSQIVLPNQRLLASVDSFIDDQIDLVITHAMRCIQGNNNGMVQSVAIQSVFRPNATVGRARQE